MDALCTCSLVILVRSSFFVYRFSSYVLFTLNSRLFASNWSHALVPPWLDDDGADDDDDDDDDGVDAGVSREVLVLGSSQADAACTKDQEKNRGEM
jgi:hypothetical protein